jgi:deazaflavin-dependent oxidoreductase (nitroreductase family)
MPPELGHPLVEHMHPLAQLCQQRRRIRDFPFRHAGGSIAEPPHGGERRHERARAGSDGEWHHPPIHAKTLPLLAALARLTAAEPVVRVLLRVLPPIDRWLLSASGGRIGSAPGRTLLLATTGARSGLRRETPLFYVRDGARLVLVASKGGSPTHPDWYRNLVAHPECEVVCEGRTAPYRARVAAGDDRERLWRLACDAYAGYAAYAERARPREIPVVVLEPLASGETR